MQECIFQTGEINTLGALYDRIQDCAINNLKESLRTIVKRTGIIMSGDSFAAYINGDKLVVPIGSILFGNYELYAPKNQNAVELDLPLAGDAYQLTATLEYANQLPYPIMPEPGTITVSQTHDTLAMPTIQLSLEESASTSDTKVIIGQLSFDKGVPAYQDLRRDNAMMLIDPPDAIVSIPVIDSLEVSFFQLPDMSSVSPDQAYEFNNIATYLHAEWLIPRGMAKLQYFILAAVPYKSGVESWEQASTVHYIPTAEELATLGPRPRAYANMQCVPGVTYHVYLYGYFDRLSLIKHTLAFETATAIDLDDSPDDLSVVISNLTPTYHSYQITPVYSGPGKLQVFIQSTSSVSDIIDQKNLVYDGPIAPVVHSSLSDTYIVARVVNSYNRITHVTSTLLHEVVAPGTQSEREEQWAFCVPCTSDPNVAAPVVSFATFIAPFDFEITKAIFYLDRELEYSDLSALADLDLKISDGVSTLTLCTASGYSAGSTIVNNYFEGHATSFATTPSFSAGDELTLQAVRSPTLSINPYYGTAILYIKKVIA